MPIRPPSEGWRAISSAPVLRETADQAPRLVGHFARFNTFNEIDSVIEGRFLERITPGAFRKTFAENGANIRMLLNHGKDPQVGDKPIGAPRGLSEDSIGPAFEGELFPSVPPLVVDGLRAGQYGVSYRFSVVREDWDPKPKRSDVNPLGLPERTIREARVYEFGPVTFPADRGADIAVRSITDQMNQPEAPSLGAAETHPEPERRDDPAPIAAPQSKERPTVDTSQYHTLDEMGARVRELNAEIERGAQIPGVLPAAEQEAFDAKVDERAALDAAMTAWRQRLELVRNSAPEQREAPAVIVRKAETDIYDLDTIERSAGTPEKRSQALRDNAMRAADTMRVPGERYDQDKSRERLANLLDYNDSPDKEIARLVLATNSPQYRSAFNRYILSGGEERGTALAVGVDGTGGFSVPVTLDPTVVATGAWAAINPIRATCRTVTISGTDTWQALTANAIVAAYAAEAAAATEQGPTFTKPEFIAKRAHAAVTLSYEMLQDRADITGELSTLIGEAKDNLEDTQFTVGVGTTVFPQGIGLKDAFTRADSAGASVAVADVLAMEAALPIRHRLGAAWYLSRAAIRAIQAWETTGGQLFNSTNGYPAVGNPTGRPGGNTGMTLLGYPVYETPSMPWTPSTTDTTWGVLMNPRNYVIVDRVGLSVRVIPDAFDAATGFPTGQSFVYAFWRNTARVLNVDGGRQGGVQ